MKTSKWKFITIALWIAGWLLITESVVHFLLSQRLFSAISLSLGILLLLTGGIRPLAQIFYYGLAAMRPEEWFSGSSAGSGEPSIPGHTGVSSRSAIQPQAPAERLPPII